MNQSDKEVNENENNKKEDIKQKREKLIYGEFE